MAKSTSYLADPAIVRADCDPKAVARDVYRAAIANSGQVCIAIKRVYVHEDIYDDFIDAIREEARAAAAKMGDGMADGVEYGPINNAAQLARVKELVQDAMDSGATVVAGGPWAKVGPSAKEGGFYYPPTVVTDVRDDMRVVVEEQFGPVLPVLPYQTDDEAVERANGSQYGLGASVWSSDENAAARIAQKLDAGSVWVNCHLSLGSGQMPFGGRKQSGLGAEHSEASDLNAYTEPIVIRRAVATEE